MITWLVLNIYVVNLWYAVAGLVALAATIGLFFDYFFNQQQLYRKWLAAYIWPILILVSAGGVATTLLYSEVFGFVPCSLCWLQRVALYPLVLLSLVAFKLKDTKYFPLYGLAISGFGLLVAVYHYIYQAVPAEVREAGLVPCLADGSADCAEKLMEVFGFVTFPFLSAVIFLFLIVLFLHMSKASKEG